MTQTLSQPCILSPPPAFARSLSGRLRPGTQPASALRRLRDGFPLDWGVVAIGEPLTRSLDVAITGLKSFSALSGRGVDIPSTQRDFWIFLHARDRSELFERHESLKQIVEPVFTIEDAVDTFMYRDSRDLTGYEDGTENPVGEAASAAALAIGAEGLAGSSFAAVQRWEHDLARFGSFSPAERDDVIGRQIDTNEELTGAPASSHVKRTAQESFEPPAFMVRRSMPWETPFSRGLEFIAFVASLDKFERMLMRMTGLDDGIVDALFTFSRPVTGGYYWCPPVAGTRLDLRLAGI